MCSIRPWITATAAAKLIDGAPVGDSGRQHTCRCRFIADDRLVIIRGQNNDRADVDAETDDLVEALEIICYRIG